MTVTVWNEPRHPADFIVSEGDNFYSRDAVTIPASQTVVVGQLLGALLTIAGATSSAAAKGGNTGNGTLTLDGSTPVLAGARNGTYKIVVIEPGTNLGTFMVEGPDGKVVGEGVVGTTFANEIKFMLADGATDFVSGDEFTVTVGIEGGIDETFVPHAPAATDGSQRVAGIAIYPAVTAAGETKKIAALRRHAAVRLNDLTFAGGITAAQKAEAIEQLRARGIICRV